MIAMKYKISIELEMETPDNPTEDFIKRDIAQEISCATYSYYFKRMDIQTVNEQK